MGRTQVAHTAPLQLHTREEHEPHEEALEALLRERDAIDDRMRIIQRLAEERDRALEQMGAIRELAERSMAEAEEREAVLDQLKASVADRDRHIDGLEEKLAQLTLRVAQQDTQLSAQAEKLQRCEEAAKQAAPAPAPAAPSVDLEGLQSRLERIQESIAERDEHIDDLEAKLAQKIDRVAQLESTLQMLAEADEQSSAHA